MKNRRTIYRHLVFLAIALTAVSCSDKFFEEQAGDRITPEFHYNSLKDADISMAGVLAPLQKAMPNMLLVDGLRSDQMEPTRNADMYMRALFNNDIYAGNPYLDASDFYKVIINANEVLAHIDEIPPKDPSFDLLMLKYYKTALIGARSWSYLNLLRLYNKAVWIPDNQTSLPQQEVVMEKNALLDTLVAQLRPIIHDQRVKVQYVELRVPRYPNTKALLGEIFLEMENPPFNQYDSAAVYLKMACESYTNKKDILKVDKAFKELSWKNIFIGAENNTNENISMVLYSGNEGQPNPLATWTRYTDGYMVKPTSMLIDSFRLQSSKGLPGDVMRGDGVSFDSAGGEACITKHALDASDFYGSDIILSRAADLHLLLAEALNRSSDPAGSALAMVLLNAGFNNEKPVPKAYTNWSNNLGIRGRAYLNNKNIPAGMLDADSIRVVVEDFIVEERALELAFEGKRFTDLVRVAKRRDDPAYLADRIAAKYSDPTTALAVRTKLMDMSNWYLPFQQ